MQPSQSAAQRVTASQGPAQNSAGRASRGPPTWPGEHSQAMHGHHHGSASTPRPSFKDSGWPCDEVCSTAPGIYMEMDDGDWLDRP
ncbi:uncharacterized protein PSFLO_06993 [Pseudozyma flocculosa]|uniref:Uncharacterized protein n=1 Tax=Pseudozyma flocculosa TaxID=84751 RepID=A0A5C3FDH2_9BASI|nr:uncharacterized protein PSFLO_06993 [Pseudozyma flocculosa]